jgi:adenylylsulfate kinase-like enzyme
MTYLGSKKMESSVKQLIYISGPPCAGKSTVSKELIRRLSSIEYILGDDFWMQNEHYNFDVRLKKTNQNIVARVENIALSNILLEWVPSYGPFVDNIKNITNNLKYEFIHIVITAPKEVLEKRKLMRDGDSDLGPIDLDKYITLKNIHLFDSSILSVDRIATECINILTSKEYLSTK